MTRLRILGVAALALVMLAFGALAQETSRDARETRGKRGAIRICGVKFVRRYVTRLKNKGLKGVRR